MAGDPEGFPPIISYIIYFGGGIGLFLGWLFGGRRKYGETSGDDRPDVDRIAAIERELADRKERDASRRERDQTNHDLGEMRRDIEENLQKIVEAMRVTMERQIVELTRQVEIVKRRVGRVRRQPRGRQP